MKLNKKRALDASDHIYEYYDAKEVDEFIEELQTIIDEANKHWDRSKYFDTHENFLYSDFVSDLEELLHK